MKTILYNSCLPEKYIDVICDYCDRAYPMPPCEDIEGSTSCHPDMLGYAKGNTLFLLESYYRTNKSFFDGLDAQVEICEEHYGTYPCDIRLNAFAVKNTLISHGTAAAQKLYSAYPHHIAVKQGYAKCSTCVLGDSFITSDLGIASSLINLGCNVLTIEQGHIALDGYDYGFIGGSICALDNGTAACFGGLDTHPDGDKIFRFAKENGYDIIDFQGEKLCDFGGILILEN